MGNEWDFGKEFTGMPATLAELAALVNGRVVGEKSITVDGAVPLPAAAPGKITLVDQPERVGQAIRLGASAAVVPEGLSPSQIAVIQVADPHQAFAEIVSFFRPPRPQRRVGISPLAVISPTAKIGEDVDIYPFATIGDDVEIGRGCTIHSGVHIMAGCKIGADVTIFPNAVLYEDTMVGPRCVIHAGAVLGAHGFGYCCRDGRHQLAAQLGNVILEAEVEVGACATIDRGTYGPTTIGEGTKIDNLVLIAHNCSIGRHNLICGQVGIAGSCSTGDYVTMAGQAGVRDHIHIGEGAVLGAMAGVMKDVPARTRVVGIPATPEREQMLKQAALTKLPEMRRELKRLRVLVEKLAAESNGRLSRSIEEELNQLQEDMADQGGEELPLL